MNTFKVIAFLLAVTAGIVAAPTAPAATVLAFAAAVCTLFPIRWRRPE